MTAAQDTQAVQPATGTPAPETDPVWLRRRYMKNPRDAAFHDVLEDVIVIDPKGQTASPARFGRHGETRGIVLTAPSGEGKTTLLDRNLGETGHLGFWDGERGCVLKVTVPGEATLKGVALGILEQTGYRADGARKLQVGEAWRLVRHRLALLKIAILWIDEAHHLLTSAPGRDAATSLRMLKSTLQGESAVVVILAGIPILADLMRNDTETDRRFLKITLDPITTEQGRASLQRFIEALCHHAQISGVPDPHFLDRLLCASNTSLGIAIEYVHHALGRAAKENNRRLELRHFRRVHMLSGRAGRIGPFDEAPWESLVVDLDAIAEAGA
jgi:hypothetical protein